MRNEVPHQNYPRKPLTWEQMKKHDEMVDTVAKTILAVIIAVCFVFYWSAKDEANIKRGKQPVQMTELDKSKFGKMLTGVSL